MLLFWGLLYQCVFSYSKLCLLLFYDVYPGTCTWLAKPSDVFSVPAAWLLLSIVMGLTAVDDVRSICSAAFFFFVEKILRKPIRIYGIGTEIVTEHSLSTCMLACMDIWELYWNLFLSSAAPSCFQCLHGLTTVSLISSALLSLTSASLNAVVPYTLKWDVPMLPELCVVSVLTFLIFGRCFVGSDELFLDWSVAPDCVIGMLVFILSVPQTGPVLFWSIARRLCPFERAALESSVNYQCHTAG